MSGVVDVVIPARNAAPYLAEAIESVLENADRLNELIVVDDGSTDDTASIAEAYPGVRVLRQLASGAGVARNRGAAASATELISFLDSDDVWIAGTPDPRLELLLEDPAVDLASGHLETFARGADGRWHATGDTYRTPLFSALILRRSAFDQLGGIDESLSHGQDLDFLLRASDAGLRFGSVDALVGRYRLHPDSMSRDRARSSAAMLTALRDSIRRKRGATP